MAIASGNISTTTGIPVQQDACVVIVRTEWNDGIVSELERGARVVLESNQVQVVVLTVPGAVEIPFAIRNYWDTHKYTGQKPHAFIALGCVIQGDTPHFDYVCQSVTQGITQLNISLPVPTIFGILTVLNEQQAQDRIGGSHGHKGTEAAVAALKMMALVQQSCTRKPRDIQS
jgi:6,7-dimethyl-8-ribityllumazine synthase